MALAVSRRTHFRRRAGRVSGLRTPIVCLAVALAVTVLGAPWATAASTGSDASGGLTPEGRQVIYPKSPEEMEALARTNPLELLRLSLQWYEQRVTSYVCDFVKQEEIGGKLQKTETMRMKFREKPFSLRLNFVSPNQGQDVTYVEGAAGNKIVVHPVGLAGLLVRTVKLSPTSKTALKHSRRPLTAGGCGNMLRFILPPTEEAQAKGDLKLEYLGIRNEGGRPAYVFKRTLPQGKGYPCYVLTIYIDQRFLLPVRSDAYNWDGTLRGQYRYMNLVPNPGLTDDDFDPDKRF